MPFVSILQAKKEGFPTKAEGVPMTLAQINKLANIYDALKKEGEVDNPMAVAWTTWKKLYKKVGDKWVKKKASYSFPICFSNAKIKQEMEIHILPLGEWKHALYGDIKIGEDDVEEFVQNFYKGIRKGVAITEGHDGGLTSGELPSIGWFQDLLNKGEKGLWGVVKWTEKGRELLEQKAFKYFSPEFFTVYEDPETHKLYNNVLTGGALTNSPYFKGLKSIVMSELLILDQFNQDNIMTKEIKEEKKDLSESENEEENEEEEENEKIEETKDDEAAENDKEKKEENEEEEKAELSDKKEVVEKKSSEKHKMTYREPTKSSSAGRKIVYQIMNSANIELSEKKDLSEFKKELLRTGTWQHGAGKNGVLKVTKKMLENIVKNFKDKVLDNVFVPLGHPTSDSPSSNVGEVTDLVVDSGKLMATVDVKDKITSEKIEDGRIKAISASIAEDYVKKDSGKSVGPTLFHAALVSEPYIKGMAGFVPLSEELEDSIVIPIMNMEEPLTLDEIDNRMKKIEEKIGLSDDSEKDKEEEREENKKEKISEETPEEESSTEETSEETTNKSSEVGEKTEEEEKKEVKTEETEAEETENGETKPETEEAKEGVDLAEAEKQFGELLGEGKVTPAERELLLPLLTSKTEIELGEGGKVASGKALYEYLKKQSPKFSLSEEGTSDISDEKEKEKKEKIPEDVKRQLDKMELSEELQEEAYKEFKEKKGEESTPF